MIYCTHELISSETFIKGHEDILIKGCVENQLHRDMYIMSIMQLLNVNESFAADILVTL